MGRVRVDVLRVGSGTGTKSTGRVYPFLPVKISIFHDVGTISNVFLISSILANVNSRSRSLYAVVRPSVCRLSVCLSSVTFVLPIQGMKFSAMFLRHFIRWPSVDIQVKFYGDRPRETSKSVVLKTRGIAEYSDFGPIERFISETVQGRSLVLITNSKSHMSFRLVPNSVTLDDLERRNSPNRCIISLNSVTFGVDYIKVLEDTPIPYFSGNIGQRI